MIKNFEEFLGKNGKSLNEKKYSTYDYDYQEMIMEIIADCASDNIKLVKEMGGEFKPKREQKHAFYTARNGEYDARDMESIKYKRILSFEIDDDIEFAENLFGENIMYVENGNFLVAITDDGERIPVDFWSCPDGTIVSINACLKYQY